MCAAWKQKPEPLESRNECPRRMKMQAAATKCRALGHFGTLEFTADRKRALRQIPWVGWMVAAWRWRVMWAVLIFG